MKTKAVQTTLSDSLNHTLKIINMRKTTFARTINVAPQVIHSCYANLGHPWLDPGSNNKKTRGYSSQYLLYYSTMRQYYVYIMTNKKNGTLYIGVSSNLVRRVYQHQQGKIAGFTKKYGLRKLVYFEVLDDIQAAISREKQLKNWKRFWKLSLIDKQNSNWENLYFSLL